jgi:hypothetical protein
MFATIDATAVDNVRAAIEARIVGLTPDVAVADFESRHIERVMEAVEGEALMRFPLSADEAEDEAARWCRVQFYREQVLATVTSSIRPRMEAAFDQYVAATIRGGRGGRMYTVDDGYAVDQYAGT